MSWYISIDPTSASAFAAAVNALELPEYTGEVAIAEKLDQFKAAKSAVIALQQSGAFGDPSEGYYGGSLSGHANPDHTVGDSQGMGLESIGLNVYRTSRAPVMEGEQAETSETSEQGDSTPSDETEETPTATASATGTGMQPLTPLGS